MIEEALFWLLLAPFRAWWWLAMRNPLLAALVILAIIFLAAQSPEYWAMWRRITLEERERRNT